MTTDAIRATAARVEEQLEGLGSAFSKVDATTFYAKRGSAVVGIRVLPHGEDAEALVRIEAPVVEGARLNEDVLRQLLEFNHGSTWGAFGVREDGVVTCHHTLLGSALDARALVPAVLEVARIADDWDDVIVDQAGGKTAVDRLKQRLQKPTIEPPPAEGA